MTTSNKQHRNISLEVGGNVHVALGKSTVCHRSLKSLLDDVVVVVDDAVSEDVVDVVT